MQVGGAGVYPGKHSYHSSLQMIITGVNEMNQYITEVC